MKNEAKTPLILVEKVNHPAHYEACRKTYEPADASMWLPHPLASAFEYIARSKYKGCEIEDLNKAVWWLDRLISNRVLLQRIESVLRFPDRCAAFASLCSCDDDLAIWWDNIFYFKFTASGIQESTLTLRNNVIERIQELEAKNEQVNH